MTREEDPFVPTNMDLAGFWDMVHIQVIIVKTIMMIMIMTMMILTMMIMMFMMIMTMMTKYLNPRWSKSTPGSKVSTISREPTG